MDAIRRGLGQVGIGLVDRRLIGGDAAEASR
jgi:hypothetical protein